MENSVDRREGTRRKSLVVQLVPADIYYDYDDDDDNTDADDDDDDNVVDDDLVALANMI